MFIEIDQSLVRQRNEELMHEARKRHLQRRLRANREQPLGTRSQVDSRSTATGVIDVEQERGAHKTLRLRKERQVPSIRALALGLLGRWRNSLSSTPR